MRILFFLSLLFLAQFAQAQFTIAGTDAVNTSCGCYTLTNTQYQSGAVWNDNLFDLNTAFDFSFSVHLGADDAGADGMAFVLQNTGLGEGLGGVGGNGLGFEGITPSLGVLLDTYQNGPAPENDPAYDHIALFKNGGFFHGGADELVPEVQMSSSAADVEDGAFHDFRIVWDPVGQNFTVYFDGILRLSYNGDIINDIFGGNPNVYWGVTARTGWAANEQKFCMNINPTANSQSGLGACTGTPFQFSDDTYSPGGPITDWVWDFGDGNTGSGQTPSNTYAADGSYTVGLTVTDASGCTATNNFTLISGTPTTTVTATPDAICAGGEVTVDAQVTPPPGPGCQYTLLTEDDYWFGGWENNVDVTVLTNGANPVNYAATDPSNSFLINVNEGDVLTLTYNGTGTNGAPGYEEENQYILYDTQGNPLFQNGDMATNTAPNPASVFMTTVTCNNPIPTYSFSWDVGSDLIADGTAQSSNVTVTNGGWMYVTISDGTGCNLVDSTNVSITSGGLNAGTNSSGTVCAGQTVDMFTLLGGGPSAGGSWTNSGGGSVSGTFDPTTMPADVYTYTLSGGSCGDASANVTMTIGSLSVSSSVTHESCTGIGNGSITINDAGYTYIWAHGGATNTATGLVAGTYTVTVDDGSCSTAESFNVTVGASLTAAITPISPSCDGVYDGSVTGSLTGGTTPYNYLWNTSETVQTVTGITAGNYSVTILDVNGCSADAAVVLGGVFNVATNLSVTDASCSGVDNGSAVAAGLGGQSPYTFEWGGVIGSETATGLASGNMELVVFDSNGCNDTTLVVVGESAGITLSASSTNTQCAGVSDGAVLTIVSGGSTPYTYLWSSGATNADLTGVGSGTFSVTVQDANGCGATSSATVGEGTAMETNINATASSCASSCDGSISLSSTGSGPYTYAWSSAQTSGSISDLCPGTYAFTVTDALGCNNQGDTIIVSNDSIQAVLSVEFDSVLVDVTVGIDSESEGLNGSESIEIHTGDGTTFTNASNTYSYAVEGVYDVELVVTDTNGCVSTATDQVTVYTEIEEVTMIPNVFTPNADLQNDVFVIHYAGAAQISGSFFNRWGQVIGSYAGSNGGWDGRTDAGEEVPEGTYFYSLKIELSTGEVVDLNGSISLLR